MQLPPQSKCRAFPSLSEFFPCPFLVSSPSSPRPWQQPVCSSLIVLPFSECYLNGIMSYVCTLLSLASFTEWNACESHSCCISSCSFLLLSRIPLCGCTTACLFILSSKDIRVLSSFWHTYKASLYKELPYYIIRKWKRKLETTEQEVKDKTNKQKNAENSIK